MLNVLISLRVCVVIVCVLRLCVRVCVFNLRMVRNISRGEEGRVLSEDLHRILGETC